MGFFGPKQILCPAGVWTEIISRSFVQMPASYSVHLTSHAGHVGGEFEEKKSRWIFPGEPVRGVLRPVMSFERGYWNTFHSVSVRPSTDCVADVS